jgi:hypothetical protein
MYTAPHQKVRIIFCKRSLKISINFFFAVDIVRPSVLQPPQKQ